MINKVIKEFDFTVKLRGDGVFDLYCDGEYVCGSGTVSSVTRDIGSIIDYELYELEKQKNGWWSYLGTNIKNL